MIILDARWSFGDIFLSSIFFRGFLFISGSTGCSCFTTSYQTKLFLLFTFTVLLFLFLLLFCHSIYGFIVEYPKSSCLLTLRSLMLAAQFKYLWRLLNTYLRWKFLACLHFAIKRDIDPAVTTRIHMTILGWLVQNLSRFAPWWQSIKIKISVTG